jgi:hypothetical protein
MKVHNAVTHLRVMLSASALAKPQNEFILPYLSSARLLIFLLRNYKKKQTELLPCCWQDAVGKALFARRCWQGAVGKTLLARCCWQVAFQPSAAGELFRY